MCAMGPRFINEKIPAYGRTAKLMDQSKVLCKVNLKILFGTLTSNFPRR